jgi:hypothetical protein
MQQLSIFVTFCDTSQVMGSALLPLRKLLDLRLAILETSLALAMIAFSFRLPVLTRDGDYQSWASQIRAFLITHDGLTCF